MSRKTGKAAVKARQQTRAAKMAKQKRELAEAGVKLGLPKPSAKELREKEEELKKLYMELFPKKKGEGEQAEQEQPHEEQPEQKEEQAEEQPAEAEQEKQPEQQEQAEEQPQAEQKEEAKQQEQADEPKEKPAEQSTE